MRGVRMKLIIDIPEEVKAEIDAKHTNAHIEMITEEAIQNGTPIPDNDTNGNSVIKMFCKGIVRISSKKMYQ